MLAHFKDCSISIRNTIILTSVNLTLKKNQCIYLSGTNGSGKTVFMESMLGVHKYIHGSHQLNIKDVCYIPDISFFGDDERVKDVLKAYAFFYNQNIEFLSDYLVKLNIDPLAKVATLSLGTKKKLELLPLFFDSYPLYVLDEIFQGLDSDTVLVVGAQLQQHFDKGASLIFTEHNPNIVDYLNYLIPTMEVYKCENKKVFKHSSY